jgi:hypothetical protein
MLENGAPELGGDAAPAVLAEPAGNVQRGSEVRFSNRPFGVKHLF